MIDGSCKCHLLVIFLFFPNQTQQLLDHKYMHAPWLGVGLKPCD